MNPHHKLCAFAASLLLITLPAMGQGTAKKKPELPEHVLNASYVYVEAYDGNEYDPRLLPEDRQAIADVQTAIQKWGRYHLTIRRSDAEIVVQVRKGRLASAQARVDGSIGTVPVGVQLPPSSRTETAVRAGVGGEIGPPDDLFWVYAVDTKGELSVPYWRKTQKDGLKAPGLDLFKKFREDVEAAAAAQAKKKASAAQPGRNASSTPAPPAHP